LTQPFETRVRIFGVHLYRKQTKKEKSHFATLVPTHERLIQV
jgi:hypothetical protein